MNPDMWPLLILIGAALLAGIALLFVVSRLQTAKPLNKAWYQEQWEGILAQAEDGTAGRQLAIINGDKLLDRAMLDKGFKGKNMGDRLKKHPSSFSQINQVWFAHKLRNRIAHENGFEISQENTKQALRGLEKGLRDLGALR